jgi:hypothetical protein
MTPHTPPRHAFISEKEKTTLNGEVEDNIYPVVVDSKW